MKFRCERDVVVEALNTAGRAVSPRGGLPILLGIKASLKGDQLCLTGSDLDMTISTTITVSGSEDGTVVMPSRLTADIAKALPPGAISFDVADEALVISAGRSEFNIHLLTGDEFPKSEPTEGTGVSLKTEELAVALSQVVPAASADDSRPVLTGVLFAAESSGLRLVATDSYRLAIRDVAGAAVLKDGENVLIPSRALGELNRVLSHGDKVDVTFSDTQAVFEVGDAKLVTRLIDGDFPNYMGLVPDDLPNKLKVKKSELLEALKRVKLLARDSTAITLKMKSGALELIATTQDVGEAKESVECDFDGEEMSIGFNPQFLLEGAEAAPADELTIETVDGFKPALIRCDGMEEFLYLIMPVRG